MTFGWELIARETTTSRLLKKALADRCRVIYLAVGCGGGDARRRRSDGRTVQLRGPGGAGSGGSSAADDPGDRERGAGGAERDFAALYAPIGRPSIAPEKLLRAMLLQAFYSIRSERQLMERMEFDLLFRWFVGLGVDDPAWDHSSFSKNRDRLLEGEIAAKFLAAVLAQPRVKRLLSNEHFSVDGTLIEAWASMKSFKPKDGSDNAADRRRAQCAKQTSTARSARTRHMPRRPIRMPDSTARGRAWRQSSASSVTA